ncbi:MAG: elongation factor G, partial [Candidatus Zixiibacteriota bacterium]
GVEPQSETVWRQADKYQVPRIAFINKMDRVGADFDKAIKMIRERLGANTLPIQLPMGQGDMFTGIIDLLTMRFRLYHEETLGATFQEQPIPQSLMELCRKRKEELLESLSDYDDKLLEKFINEKPINVNDIKSALRKATLDVKVVPVLCGSAFKNKGIQKLLDAVVDFLPAPSDLPPIKGRDPVRGKEQIRKPSEEGPFSALAFKIITEPYLGKLTYLRVYSGTLKAGSAILNSSKNRKERISRLLQMHANKREDIQEVWAGDIAAAVGLRFTQTGDTLCDSKSPIILEMMSFPEPVIFVAIEPKTKTDQEKLSEVLNRLSEEDPTFKVRIDEETNQTIISGMGELHLEILVERMIREFRVKANVGKPQVAYKETISSAQEGVGKFIKQTGGRGHFGVAKIKVEPLPRSKGFILENQISAGTIPKEFIPAVESGVKEALENGPLAGYPVVDLKAILLDGDYHDEDSNDLAFRIAGSMALQDAVRKAGPKLLEPLMDVEVVVPEEYMGEVINDLNSRRGKILGIKPRVDAQVISAVTPLSEMFGYATALRSLSQGRAIYTMEFSRYGEVPENISERIITKIRGF